MVALRYFPSALALVAMSLCLAVGLSAAQAKSKSAAKAPAKATAKTGNAAKKAVKGKAKANPQPASEAGYRRSGQQAPSQERYTEIEQALQLRGYLEDADGKWDKDSVEALKRFQRDQSLKDDGKIGALSLIALGLGPKRTTTTVAQNISNSGSAPPQVE